MLTELNFTITPASEMIYERILFRV